MTQRKSKIEQWSAQVHVVAVSPEYGEVSLGDLRKLVAAADGLPDNAEVQLKHIESHYDHADTYTARLVIVESRETQ